MHKGIIMLTKANTTEEAQSNVESFLEQYQDQVWDWYVIGGRWSGVLDNNYSTFKEQANKLFKNKDFISMQDIKDNKEQLQALWGELGETSTNPYNRDNYHNEETDNILPATKCEKVIKEWTVDTKEQAEKFWNEMLKAKKEAEEDPKKYDMSAYYAKLYANTKHDNFSFESTTYDIEEYTNTPPKELTGYYAVMVDIHN